MPLPLQNRAFFEWRKGVKVPRKGEEEGWPAKGAKRKKGRVKTGQTKVGKRPVKEGKRPIKRLMGCFRVPRRAGKRPL